ncbi:Crp/Fnr family transcriptional regulator [Pseudooceanicola aestuarii]|uniref:Crp/Fnr family transcriptional regulator n=1 Tax=Pseudooceanicola aestuarii TaxID=2697319 RepID=UPI0013D72C4E|nr:Crp/Fnr family transcriptional regulator [Pseudooceanicola aestuarii]
MNLPTKFSQVDLAFMTPEVLDFADRYSRTVTLPGNSIVYFQDDPTDQVFFVLRGYVRLSYITEDGLVTLHSIVPPGRSFGEAGAFEGFGYCDTASTVGETELIALGTSWRHDTGAAAQALRYELAKLIARRHRDQVEFTRALYRPNLTLRLSHSLLRLLDLLGNEIRYKGRLVQCLGPVVTQRDLGSMARGTRENVNKALRRWAREEIITLEDRHIIILDRDRLEKVALAAG